jgi:hypothetical protein
VSLVVRKRAQFSGDLVGKSGVYQVNDEESLGEPFPFRSNNVVELID